MAGKTTLVDADCLRLGPGIENRLEGREAPIPGHRGGSTDSNGALLQRILDHAAEKTVVVAVGNPYLAKDFPSIQNYLCTFSIAPVSEASAVKALFGEIPIRGHLPVSIPTVAQRGAGKVLRSQQ